MINMSQFIDRWKSTTPPFFKKLGFWAKLTTIVAGGLAAGATAIITAGVAIPIIIPAILGGIAAASGSIAATAGLATEDKELIDKQYNTDNK